MKKRKDQRKIEVKNNKSKREKKRVEKRSQVVNICVSMEYSFGPPINKPLKVFGEGFKWSGDLIPYRTWLSFREILKLSMKASRCGIIREYELCVECAVHLKMTLVWTKFISVNKITLL